MIEEIEPICRSYWKLNRGTSQLGLQGIGGPKPRWQFTEATGAYYQKLRKGGIDWWQYRTIILEPLLIPYAQECNIQQAAKEKLPIIIQEDKAPAHNSKYQQEVFNLHKILCLL